MPVTFNKSTTSINRSLFYINPVSGIVTDGLIMYYDAESSVSYPGTGTIWYDLSPSGLNATMVGTPAFINTTPKSFVLNNPPEQYFSAFRTNTSYTALTFISIIYVTNFSWGSTQAGVIFNTASNITGMVISDTSREILYNWNDAVATYTYNTGLALPLANTGWSYIAVSVSPTLTTFCVNNAFNTFTYSAPSTTIGANLILGADNRYSGVRRLRANMAVSQMYNRALSQTELTQNYNYFKGLYGL